MMILLQWVVTMVKCTRYLLNGHQASVSLVNLHLRSLFKTCDYHMIVNNHRVDEDDCLRKLIREGRYLGNTI